MKVVKFFKLFVFIVFFAVFLWIAFYNSDSVKVVLCKDAPPYKVPLYAVMFVSFCLGGVLVYLYSLIGTLKNKCKILSLNKKLSTLEEKIKDLLPKKENKNLVDEKEENTGDINSKEQENDNKDNIDNSDNN